MCFYYYYDRESFGPFVMYIYYMFKFFPSTKVAGMENYRTDHGTWIEASL